MVSINSMHACDPVPVVVGLRLLIIVRRILILIELVTERIRDIND